MNYPLVVQYVHSHQVKRRVQIIAGDIMRPTKWFYVEEPDFEYETFPISNDQSHCKECAFKSSSELCYNSPQCGSNQKVAIVLQNGNHLEIGTSIDRVNYKQYVRVETVIKKIDITQVDI